MLTRGWTETDGQTDGQTDERTNIGRMLYTPWHICWESNKSKGVCLTMTATCITRPVSLIDKIIPLHVDAKAIIRSRHNCLLHPALNAKWERPAYLFDKDSISILHGLPVCLAKTAYLIESIPA